MKNTLVISAIAVLMIVISCKKERTCSCTVNDITTTTTTPRSADSPTVEVNTTNQTSEFTAAHVKKDDLSRIYNCNTRVESSVDTHTTMVSIKTVSSTPGFTFNTFRNEVADVKTEDVLNYACDIK